MLDLEILTHPPYKEILDKRNSSFGVNKHLQRESVVTAVRILMLFA